MSLSNGQESLYKLSKSIWKHNATKKWFEEEWIIMPNTDSKTYIVNDQPTETDALDFTPYVEILADIIQTGNTPLTIGVFGTWAK